MAKRNKNEMLSCIEIYENVLSGEIKRFPRFFWKEISDVELRELLRYFLEQKLGWTIDDIKSKFNTYILYRYKLGGGMFQDIFKGSPFKVVDFAYPGQIKEWELKCTPFSYWTKETGAEAVRYILEKEKWTREDIKTKSIYDLLVKYGVSTILMNYFNGSPWELINIVYPSQYKPWELPYVPNGYWTEETAVQAVKWMIEEKLNWTKEDIKTKYGYGIFKFFKLEAMLSSIFNCSPFQAINAAYPGKFNINDFRRIRKREGK